MVVVLEFTRFDAGRQEAELEIGLEFELDLVGLQFDFEMLAMWVVEFELELEDGDKEDKAKLEEEQESPLELRSSGGDSFVVEVPTFMVLNLGHEAEFGVMFSIMFVLLTRLLHGQFLFCSCFCCCLLPDSFVVAVGGSGYLLINEIITMRKFT